MRASRLISTCFLLALFLGSFAPQPHAQQTVTLGNATVPLTGPWKFHIGDNPKWADPSFDDSAWGTMDLTPPPGSYDPVFGSSGFVPGWTVRGYKAYSGYAWYRLRVNIQDGQSALALKMPDSFDDDYQVYVNGQRIGEFGRFTAHGVTTYNEQPRAFPLPANLHSGPATIAIRMWMDAFTALVDPDVGGLHGPPVLGKAAAIAGLLQMDWDAVNRSLYVTFAFFAINLLVLAVALGLFWLDPKEPAYLWLGILSAVGLAGGFLVLVVYYTTWMDGTLLYLLSDAVQAPILIGAGVIFWAYWFRLDGMARLHRVVWSLVALLGLGMAMLRAPLYGSVVPVHASLWLSPLTVALKLLLGVVLVWIVVRGIRKDRMEGWLVLLVVVLSALNRYWTELLVLHVPLTFFLVGVPISFGTIGSVLFMVVITVLLLRRFLHSQHEREQFRVEMEQARQVQQMLIPEALPTVPGFTLESEYRPAQRVGGDFFQILAHPSDGSVLIVVGDVAGHGLQAAMLVSLLVGAIRSTGQFDPNPLSMLQSLNQRLLGRGHANATCLALRIEPDGSATLANAGHLPPYVNGKEMSMEGALPLGTTEFAEFPVMKFQLEPGDRLTFVSDGVVEATNEKRELFGFARTQQISNQAATIIAEAAQKFGQEDDIPVVSVVRAMAPVLVAV